MLFKKFPKIFQKIWRYRSRRTDAKNIAYLWSRSIFETFGFKTNFFLNCKNYDTSLGDSGKTVGIIEAIRPEVNSRVRNLQQNICSQISKIVEIWRSKNFTFEKVVKNPQKILGYTSRRADFKSTPCWRLRSKIFEIHTPFQIQIF